jgi:hypothetical protein
MKMLMKDPGRRWENWEPYQLPAASRWPVLLLTLAVFLAATLAASLMTLSGPQSRCVRPVGWHVTGRVSAPLCGIRGADTLPRGK